MTHNEDLLPSEDQDVLRLIVVLVVMYPGCCRWPASRARGVVGNFRPLGHRPCDGLRNVAVMWWWR